ncbi:MAG: hypothetical protein EP332_00005 [Bacteroidetes bacterium]|nr:MAG: hypothetical protein EP332_00005 [Bacteroidota bacterium]
MGKTYYFKALLCAFLFGTSFTGSAQIHSLSLKSEGEMPLDFRQRFKDRYDQNLNETSFSNDYGKRDKEAFVSLATYAVELYIGSGKLCFGDPLTNYCDSILKLVLRDQDSISSKIRVYTLRSNDVNAFSTHQGVIVISTGLIARLENEAQLAFVLAHEAAHYLKKHSLESFEYAIDSLLKKRGLSMEDRLLARLKRSREDEWEADEFAIAQVKQAKYNPNQIAPLFDILKKASIPIDDPAFPYDEIEDSNFKFRPKESKGKVVSDLGHKLEFKRDFRVETINQSKSENETIDTANYSTHPEIDLRKENFNKAFPIKNQNASALELPSRDFLLVRLIARRDALYNYIMDGEYFDAWSLSDLLQIDSLMGVGKEYEYCKIYALYKIGLAGKKQFELAEGEMPDFSITGKYEIAIRRLNSNVLQSLICRETWKLFQKDTSDALKALISDGLIEHTRNYFEDQIIRDDSLLKADVTPSGAKEALKIYFAASQFDNLKHRLQQKSAVVSEPESSAIQARPVVHKMLVISPRIINLDFTKNPIRQIHDAYKMQGEIEEMIMTSASDLGIQAESLHFSPEDTNAVAKYNHFAALIDWYYFQASDSLGYPLTQANMKEIANYYGTDYFNFNLNIQLKYKRRFNPNLFVLAILIPPYAPFYTHWQLTPYKAYLLYNSTHNIRTGNLEYEYLNNMRNKYGKLRINAHIYNSLNQIKP